MLMSLFPSTSGNLLKKRKEEVINRIIRKVLEGY